MLLFSLKPRVWQRKKIIYGRGSKLLVKGKHNYGLGTKSQVKTDSRKPSQKWKQRTRSRDNNIESTAERPKPNDVDPDSHIHKHTQ